MSRPDLLCDHESARVDHLIPRLTRTAAIMRYRAVRPMPQAVECLDVAAVRADLGLATLLGKQTPENTAPALAGATFGTFRFRRVVTVFDAIEIDVFVIVHFAKVTRFRDAPIRRFLAER